MVGKSKVERTGWGRNSSVGGEGVKDSNKKTELKNKKLCLIAVISAILSGIFAIISWSIHLM